MLPAHQTQLWAHALEFNVLACPAVIVSMAGVPAFLPVSVHLADLGLASVSAEKGAFHEAFGQYHLKCEVFVWNKKHATSIFYS